MFDLDLLKLTNLFNPQPSPTFPFGTSGTVNASMPPDQNQPDLMSAIAGLLNPKEEQFQKYSDLLKQMPQRSDYPPSKLQKIGGFLAGIGTGGPVGIANGQVVGYKSNIPEGLAAQRSITDQSYNQALGDWANQVEPTSKIAQMESNRNVNNRATALGTLQRQQAQEKLDQQVKYQNEEQNRKNKELAIKQQRANVYEYKAKNPNLVIKEDAAGNLVGINPQSGESDAILDADGNPVKSAVLTDAEKIKLQHENKLIEIGATGNENRKTAGVKGDITKENKGAANWQLFNTPDGKTVRVNSITGEVVPVDVSKLSKVSGTGSAAKTDTPAQQRIALGNKASQIAIQHPEWSKYIKIDKGMVTVTPPGRFTGPDKDTYDQITAALGLSQSGQDIQLKPENKTSQLTQPQSRELTRPEDPKIQAARSKVEPGYVLITDGKSFGQIKPSDVSKLPKGWMVVK